MERLFSAYRGDAPYVFVCYAHDDSTTVYPELARLRDEGINIWYDEGISAGANWRAAIGESLLGADRILFYISRQSLASDHCNREINLALDQGKEVVPIYLEDVELTPDLMVGLNRIQALHKHRDTDYYTHLFDALGLAAPVTGREEGASPATPRRRGLRQWQVAGGTVVLAMVLLGTWAYFNFVDLRNSYSVAVLSFEDLNTEDETGVLARRFSETVLDHLARAAPNPMYGKPRMGSRADAFRLAMQNTKASEIGDALGVGYLIDGSLERSGDTYLVNTQVIRAADGTEIWSKAYDCRTSTSRSAAGKVRFLKAASMYPSSPGGRRAYRLALSSMIPSITSTCTPLPRLQLAPPCQQIARWTGWTSYPLSPARRKASPTKRCSGAVVHPSPPL